LRRSGGVAGPCTILAAGAGPTQLTTGADSRSPAWLPSHQIVFQSSAGGVCCGLFIVDPATRVVRDLHLDGSEPSWSPDERFIVFQRGSQIWVADANGTHAREILDVGSGSPDAASWGR